MATELLTWLSSFLSFQGHTNNFVSFLLLLHLFFCICILNSHTINFVNDINPTVSCFLFQINISTKRTLSFPWMEMLIIWSFISHRNLPFLLLCTSSLLPPLHSSPSSFYANLCCIEWISNGIRLILDVLPPLFPTSRNNAVMSA